MVLNKNRLSQFFTPDYIAEFMVKNIKQHYLSSHNESSIDKIKVLEPSAGTVSYTHLTLPTTPYV